MTTSEPTRRPAEGQSVQSSIEQRAIAVLGRVRRLAVRLAVAALVAGAVAWVALLTSLSGTDDTAVVLIVAAVALSAPPAILLLFAFALAALRRIPQRVRETPAIARGHAAEIRRRAGEVAARPGLVGSVGSIVRLWRSVAGARDLVEQVGAAALLVTPWMLPATALAVAGALLEVVLGLVGLVALALLT